MLIVFIRVTGLRPHLSIDGFGPIRNNLVFIAGSFLPAVYLHMPRLMVTKLFPEFAHIYLATAQLCQGASLIFNVRYQIPYRKIIAHRPKLFQQRMWPVMRLLLMLIMLLVFIYLSFFISGCLILPQEKFFAVLVLMPMMLGETMMFAVLAAHLGYIQWFANKRSVLATYLACVAIACLEVAFLFITGFWHALPLPAVPALTTLNGSIWLAIIIRKYFRRSLLNA